MPRLNVRIVADTSELEDDLERIRSGKLSLPTVSAVALLIDDEVFEEMPVYIGEEDG
jgi:hypothetical protein